MTQNDSNGGVVQGTWVLYGGACGDGGTRYQNTLTPDLQVPLFGSSRTSTPNALPKFF